MMVLALAAAASASLMPTLASALTPEELFRKVSPAIWVVIPRDDQGRALGSGSAVVVGAGRLITNCHVLRKATAITLRREREELTATLEYPDPERDLCQIKADRLPSIAPVEIVPTAQLAVGQKAFAIGAPRGLEQSLSDGLVSALRRNAGGEVEYIQLTAPISPGSSGGGLFDEQGRLIGITTAMLAGGSTQNLNFARPAQWIQDVPNRGRVALGEFKQAQKTSAPATPTLPPLVVQAREPVRPAAAPAAPVLSSTPRVAAAPAPSYDAGPATARATAIPVAARDVQPTEQFAFQAESFAKTQRCATEPRASLLGKDKIEETYAVACADGYAMILRCQAVGCMEVK